MMTCALVLVLLCVVTPAVVTGELCTNATCEYTFVIERKSSHLYHDGSSTFDVGLNGSSLVTQPTTWWNNLVSATVPSDDVITLDGHRRDIILINGQFPGPTIDVLFETQVVVHVHNNFLHDVLTIHWHGMHQRDNLWMDGIPSITQCVIRPGDTFTYRFIADPVGTHFYHSHVQFQRTDGLFGAFLIHPKVPTAPYFPMSVMDWLHPQGESLHKDQPFGGDPGAGSYWRATANRRVGFSNIVMSDFNFYSILVNGRGRQMDTEEEWPLEAFVVESGHGNDVYRFHVVHTGVEIPMRISIDNHELTIVATDDADLKPIKVESFWIFVAETIDFEIKPNQAVDKYWIRIDTIGTRPGLGKDPDGLTPMGKAVLRYDGASAEGNPTSEPESCTPTAPCKVFNCPFEKYPVGENRECIHMDEAVSNTALSQGQINQWYGLGSSPDEEYFLNFNGIRINGHGFVAPRVPLFKNVPDQTSVCNPVACATRCDCTHTIEFPPNKVVQLVVSNYARSFSGRLTAHPFHLHGYSFAVLKMGFGPLNETTGLPTGNNPDVNCTTEGCVKTQWAGDQPTLNYHKPPLKNTIVLPPQGYVVLRIHTDNEGLWLSHCHLLRHTSRMAFLIKVGQPPPAPPNFPECDVTDFDFDLDDYLNNQ